MPGRALSGKGVVDRDEFGRRLRAARVLAGIESAQVLSDRLAGVGVEISARAIYDYEQGRSLPNVEVLMGLLLVLQPDQGWRFFLPSVNREHRERLAELAPRLWLAQQGDDEG